MPKPVLALGIALKILVDAEELVNWWNEEITCSPLEIEFQRKLGVKHFYFLKFGDILPSDGYFTNIRDCSTFSGVITARVHLCSALGL